jgi:undecaprenyl-phosphate galactose phosphotransferase
MALGLELAILIREHWLPHLFVGTPKDVFSFSQYVAHIWLWLLLLAFYIVEGLYTQRQTLWNEVGHVTKATFLGIVAVLAAVALAKLSTEVSRVTILMVGGILFLLMPVTRYWTKFLLAERGPWRKSLLILGANDTTRTILRGLAEDPVLGYQVVGLLDDDPTDQRETFGTSYGNPIRVLGPLTMAARLLSAGKAKDILIAMPSLDEEHLASLVHDLQPLSETIYVVPRMWGLPMMNLHIDGFLRQQVLMLKISNNMVKPWNIWLKRGFDLILGTILVVSALPLMVVVALAIKLNSRGPALFIQERLGYRGHTFRCLKFRSMYVDSDEQLEAHFRQNPDLAAEWKKYAKLKTKDPRLTPVGMFLRRWSLDEIPQIFNVLRGEMSIVGPRPYLPREKDRIGENLWTISTARPGMTGLWQVNGKNELSLEDRIQIEAWYVRNWSLWLDVIILAKTFRTVLWREGAY